MKCEISFLGLVQVAQLKYGNGNKVNFTVLGQIFLFKIFVYNYNGPKF